VRRGQIQQSRHVIGGGPIGLVHLPPNSSLHTRAPVLDDDGNRDTLAVFIAHAQVRAWCPRPPACLPSVTPAMLARALPVVVGFSTGRAVRL
jgi:hypothetical protein